MLRMRGSDLFNVGDRERKKKHTQLVLSDIFPGITFWFNSIMRISLTDIYTAFYSLQSIGIILFTVYLGIGYYCYHSADNSEAQGF